MNQSERGNRFKDLHDGNSVFLMPNAWDAGSATMLSSLGFSALATTSAGVCFSLGLPDDERVITRDQMIDRVRSIAVVTDLPVSADLFSGFGISPEDVGSTITNAIGAGLVGANIEDLAVNTPGTLFDANVAVERIRAARLAADMSGIPFVLTARTDAYLVGADNPFAEAVDRCNAYREAGANCLFVPGVTDPKTIGALVKEIHGPMTFVMGLKGSALTLNQLGSLGVRRVTIGGSLARATFGLIRRAAEEMATHGSFTFAEQQIPHASLSDFFGKRRSR